jgi:hypothetical protein
MKAREMLQTIKSRSSRSLLEALIRKVPNLPAPTVDTNENFHWDGYCRLYKDVIDLPIYQMMKSNGWERVTEDEFVRHIKQWSY